jgi:hypothetical protein
MSLYLRSDEDRGGGLLLMSEEDREAVPVEQFGVSYLPNSATGGAVPIDESSPYDSGSTVIILGFGTLERLGYNQTGWNTAEDGSGTHYGEGDWFIISAETALFAEWELLPVYGFSRAGDPVLMQCRKSNERVIAENPVRITFSRKAIVPDGFGGFMENPSGSATSGFEVVRISHEKASVPKNESSPIGLSTSFSLYAVLKYNSAIQEGDELIAGSRRYSVNAVDAIEIKGQAYSKRAVLTEITGIPVTIPKSFAVVQSGADGAIVSWVDLTGNGYSIERKTGTEEFAVVGSVASGVFVFNDSGLSVGTEYIYRMRANNGIGYSEYTEEKSLIVEVQT